MTITFFYHSIKIPFKILNVLSILLGNSRGVGGSKSQEIPEGMGGKRRNFRPEGRKSMDFLRICQLAPLTYFTAVSFFERFKRLKTSHSLELFAKPFWGLNIGLAIKTLKKFRSRKKKKNAGLAVSQSFA